MVILLAVVMQDRASNGNCDWNATAASPINRGPMGLLSRFRTASAPRAADVVWRKGAYSHVALGSETQLLRAPGGVPIALPAFALEFVAQCVEFAPLEEQLALYAGQHALAPMQVATLREWLPRLIDAGALVSSEQILARCATMRAATPPPIGMIGFPTGGARTALLGRALDSFAENLRQHGRAAEFVIADSSTTPQHRAAFRDLAVKFGAQYSGEEERREFVAALLARGAASPETLEFALFDPLGTGFACGANRNALLLHSIDAMFCSVDDDVVCKFSSLPELRAECVSLFSNCDPFARWLFADRTSALAGAVPVERDFLAAHEAVLGRGVGDLIPAGLTADGLSLEDAGDDLIERLGEGSARVRSSFLGHLGDPGVPSSCYYLHYERANRARLVESEAHYRAALASRSVLAAVPALSFGDASVSPGMAMGLDHRELLPPFFPVLHAEDFTHGATLWQCCPGAVAGHLPLAIFHDPPPGKTILQPRDLGPERRVVIFEFAHLLRRVIRDFDPAPHATASERMRSLGRALRELAAQPLRDFVEVLRGKILEHESEKLGWLDGQLQLDEAPDFWRRDVEQFLENARASLTAPDFDIPLDLKNGRSAEESRAFMRQLFARYGALLEEWPAIVEATRELRRSGVGIVAAR